MPLSRRHTEILLLASTIVLIVRFIRILLLRALRATQKGR